MGLRRTLVSLLAAVVLGGCATETDVAPADAGAEPPAVTISMTGRTWEAPDTIDAGLTTFRFANHGDEIHYAHAVRLDSGRTVEDLVGAYAHAVRTAGPRPTWFTRFGGPGGTAPGDTSVVTHVIEPGRYAWICPIDDSTGNPHFASGEARPFVVRAADPDAPRPAAPEATVVIRMVNYAFAVDSQLARGRHTVRVVNEGPDGHDLVMVRLEDGKTTDDLLAWLQAPDGPPPFGLGGGVAVLAAGMEAFFPVELTPGEYALVCMATAQDGRTHIEHGMVQQVTVR